MAETLPGELVLYKMEVYVCIPVVSKAESIILSLEERHFIHVYL